MAVVFPALSAEEKQSKTLTLVPCRVREPAGGRAGEPTLTVREDADRQPRPLRPLVRSWNAR
ncbi:MAG: hypothetical protein IJG25_06280 [Thermoguttaceae bacterium]|nr:hypothetical protein [Thermoguttaceae bacterium]